MRAKTYPTRTDDNHCHDLALNESVSKLDVYRHERLAFTEPPSCDEAPRGITKRTSALLKAMYYWVHSRL